MAKCDICEKGVTFGIKVSHSHRRTNRSWKPNVKRATEATDDEEETYLSIPESNVLTHLS